MEDAELSLLMDEVEFNTPSREHTDALAKTDKARPKEDNDVPTSNRRVLLSEPSLTKMEHLDPIFKEATYDAFTAILNDSGSDDDELSGISGTSNRHVNDTKKYKLFLIDEPSKVCGRVMSQGVTFCANKDCTINHRTEGNLELKKAQIYVMKSKKVDDVKSRATAFCLPTLSVTSIEPQVIKQWMSMNQTLRTWSRIFRVANNSVEQSTFVTQEEIMKEKNDLKKARDYKTPKKEKMKTIFEDTLPIKYEDFDSGPDYSTSSPEFLSHINLAFNKMQDEINSLR